MSPAFLFAACQPGFERALKDEVARLHGDWRFAFSRPGFVTFRLPAGAPERPRLTSVFARTYGVSLGRATGSDDDARTREAWRLIEARFGSGLTALKHLHVWQRAAPLPGDEGFDAASTAPVTAAVAALLALRPSSATAVAANAATQAMDLVADCALVDANEWWVGWHQATTVETRWPGGVPPLAAPPQLISRAYLKMIETLLWSELPVRAGDRCIEIGSAPGGSCLALLERGCHVTGIDPAEMDPRVLAHENFTHLRARAREVKRSVFRGCRWLAMDANVPPNYTLDTLAAIVTQPGVHPDALLLTLKLTDPAVAAGLPEIAGRLRALGYAEVRMRQLAFNRQEVCAVATSGSIGSL